MGLLLYLNNVDIKNYIANKTPTALEHLINTVKMPEKVRESLMKDYNQIYYNIKKENKTVRTARANDILFSSIQTILRSWKLREKAL